MKNSTLKFLLLISLILNISFLGAAGFQYYKKTTYWTSPFGYKMKKDHFLFEELSLRPDQMNTMREIATKFRTGIDEKRQAIATKRKELITLMRQDNPDRNAIAAVVSEISGMQEEMQRTIAMHMLDMKAGLDKEQQKKFLDLIENTMTEGRQMGCPPMQQN
ncbi:MAG: periplasmic heavy metal sensor [Nitrospiraceae bacterium]|nr:periplasmic heavy metal sensor [Nitrospiraceae bacterium]